MRHSVLRCSLVLTAMLLGTPAFSQISTDPSIGSQQSVSGVGFKAGLSNPQPRRRQSYTAELKTTRVQTLADGTTIIGETTEIRASDSQHHVLFSSTRMVPRGEQQISVTSAHVDDPVEGTHTSWNSQSKVAQIIKLPAQDQRHGCWASQSGLMRMNYGSGHSSTVVSGGIGAASGSTTSIPTTNPHLTHQTPTTEDLGTTTIQGLEAHGQRFTTVIPAGEIGNDKPLVRVNETWMAPGLGFPLRSIYDDPQSGKSTTEVVNLDLSEPSLSTFQPPDDYKVEVEELHQVVCPEPGTPWQ